MESKLKALKVVDLKDILSKSATSVPAKANKQDLIQRVLSTPAALEQYNKQYPSTASKLAANSTTDDLLALPDDVDWNEDLSSVPAEPASEPAIIPASSTPASPPTNASPPKPVAPISSTTAIAPAAPKDTAAIDPELEARRRRAERFGIPLVEPKNKPRREKNVVKGAPSADEPEKLKAREARFGTSVNKHAASTAAKRSAPVDPEEEERKRKRAERFGLKQ